MLMRDGEGRQEQLGARRWEMSPWGPHPEPTPPTQLCSCDCPQSPLWGRWSWVQGPI